MTRDFRPASSVALGPLSVSKSREWTRHVIKLWLRRFPELHGFVYNSQPKKKYISSRGRESKRLASSDFVSLEHRGYARLDRNTPNQDGRVGNLFTREPNKELTTSAWAPMSASQVAGAGR